jgi:hypothetical protein
LKTKRERERERKGGEVERAKFKEESSRLIVLITYYL